MPGDDADGALVYLPDVGWVPAESWLEMLAQDDPLTDDGSTDP